MAAFLKAEEMSSNNNFTESQIINTVQQFNQNQNRTQSK
jgi:hypothetical protein